MNLTGLKKKCLAFYTEGEFEEFGAVALYDYIYTLERSQSYTEKLLWVPG